MRIRKTVLTTGEVAKICNVAPRTVSKWFDTGHLRGYRIPGSKDRRIPVDQLVRFMRAHGIPSNGLETGVTRVLFFDADRAMCQAVCRALTQEKGFEVMTAYSALEAGAAVESFKPHALVVDVSLPDAQPEAIARFVRSQETPQLVCLVALAPGLTPARGQALLQLGFDGYLNKPCDAQALQELLDRKVGAHLEAAGA